MKKILIPLIALAVCQGSRAQEGGSAADSRRNALAAKNVSVALNVGNFSMANELGLCVGLPLARHWSAVAELRPGCSHASGSPYRHLDMTYALGARWWPWYLNTEFWAEAEVQHHIMRSRSEGTHYSPVSRDTGLALAAGYNFGITSWLAIELGAGCWAGTSTRNVARESWRRVSIGKSGFAEINKIYIGICLVL